MVTRPNAISPVQIARMVTFPSGCRYARKNGEEAVRRTPEIQTSRASLARYGAKRDFARTPEPPPECRKRRANGKETGVFCVQKHDATRLITTCGSKSPAR